MKYNSYPLTGLSKEAIQKLPEVLDTAGYAGRYSLGDYGLSINSTVGKVSEFFRLAENAAHGEEGHLVTAKQTLYAQVWIPGTKAASMKASFEAVQDALRNGTPIVYSDPKVEVACPAFGPIYEDSNLCYLDENRISNMDDK